MEQREQAKRDIEEGRAVLGIELGSTRIKATLIGADYAPIASGGHAWENRLEDGVWTYRLEDVWTGIQDAFRALREDVRVRCGTELRRLRAMGVSAMMHGYLAFGADGALLAPFRTWRNTTTEQAAARLTGLFQFNIPQRWSVAHLYQAVLNKETHVKDAAFLTTLAGYVHWKLTGERVLGVGDASGMFPIDSGTGDYDSRMLEQFDALTAPEGCPWKLRALLPRVLGAGEPAGTLSPEGARLLNPDGLLEPGVPLCPPEGDAGTGMAATNSVALRTGNVSAGTSVFAMVVLERALSGVHPEIDMVTTPAGAPVAMVHCNNCTSDINAWAGLFAGFAEAAGLDCSMDRIYEAIFRGAPEGEPDCGGLLNYSYLSGEPIVGLEEGRPLFARTPDARFTFANFARAQLCSAIATLKLGMDILTKEERVRIDALTGHGGFFKTGDAGQRLMAAALDTPVSVMETAGEGGPWGMALLAAYMADRAPGQSLEDYLSGRVFAGKRGRTALPGAADAAGFAGYMEHYTAALETERCAVAHMRLS